MCVASRWQLRDPTGYPCDVFDRDGVADAPRLLPAAGAGAGVQRPPQPRGVGSLRVGGVVAIPWRGAIPGPRAVRGGVGAARTRAA